MGSIVLCMPKYEDSNHIAEIIKRSGVFLQTYSCINGNEVLRKVSEQEVSVVICTKKMQDMGYEELSTYLPATVNMILLTKDAGMASFSSNIVRIMMPFKVDDLIGTLRMLVPDAFSVRRKKKPERSVEERNMIDNAKQLLMNRNSMSEPEAFRYIQKTSMDTGRTMLESAQMIIMLNS